MVENGLRVNKLTKWFLLSLAFLLTGSVVTAEKGSTVDANESQSKPPPHGLLNASGKRPSLQPKPSPPFVGTYSLTNPDGKVCLKAVIGVEFMVTVKKKFYYFNMNPSATRATGYCGDVNAILSLEFEGGNLEFSFVKEGKEYYVRKLSALLGPTSVCKNCKDQSYPGILDHEKLFKTTTGLSFKCKSELFVKMSSDLRLRIVPSQFQPFDLANGQFGKDFECWKDYIKRILPIIIGAIAVGIILIAIASYLVIREHRNRGYDRM